MGLLLLAGEVGVAVLALWFPRVDGFYKQYYIEGSRLCWLQGAARYDAAQALIGSDVDAARLSTNESCYVLMRGWSAQMASGVWTHKRVASVDLPVDKNTQAVVLTVAAMSRAHPQHVAIDINGRFYRDIEIPPGRADMDLRIPIRSAGNEIISFHLKNLFFRNGLGVTRLRWIQS